MIRKILRTIREILAIYFSGQIFICISELRRICRAPCLVGALSSRSWGFDLPTKYQPHNGSILRYANGWLIAIRAANYGYTRRLLKRLEIPGGPSCVDSETWLVRLDDEFRVCQRWMLWDAPYRDPAGASKNGLTDPRLFEWKGQVWSLWSAEQVLGNDWNDITNTMALAIVQNEEIIQLTLLASPRGQRREKNWMPWVVGEELRLVYALENMEVYRLSGGNLELLSLSGEPDARLRGYSGSSQVQPWGEDWICVAHYAARALRTATAQLFPTFYLHRFVVISNDFQVKELSREFFLEHKGTEFCAGLAVTDDYVLLSYGVRDLESRMMKIARDKVDVLFRA